MGEIFLAKLGEIQGFEKPIVIKKILPDLAQDQEFLRRFIEEAQIAIKLTHGNIVPVYEVGMVDGEYFLALEYVEGRDLRAILNRCRERKERMPPDLCLCLVREIANGLAYAHRKTDESGKHLELVHCDISPPNILVSWEGEVKIIDFGIAKSAIQKAQEDENIGFGKFGYMAPEQLLRGAQVDRRTDIYSTGVLLFELLTGERLFNFPPGTDYRRVAREVTAGKIDPPSERDFKLGDTFDNLVMRALRTQKEERYQSAEELRDAVQQSLYAMTPTISADALAAFVQEQFAGEVDEDRQMLSSLSQTDFEPFQTEMKDASSHTVSYALSGLWTSRGGAEFPSAKVSAPERPSKEVVVPVKTTKGGATRRLGETEKQGVLKSIDRSTRANTLLVQQRRRTIYLAAGTVLILLSIGIGLGLALRDDPDPDHVAHRADAVAARPSSLTTRLAVRPPDAGASDSALVMSFPPETVLQSDGGVASPAPPKVTTPEAKTKTKTKRRARKPKPKRRYARRSKVKPKRGKPTEISRTMVERKLKQVRREYSQFKRSYGHLLEDDWQKILFANTYGSADEKRYLRLNSMLDGLRGKMRRICERGD
jgi:serine/threonine protein kinase